MNFVERKRHEWEKKYGKEMADKLCNKFKEMFSDSDFKTEEEVLMAISVVSHRLKQNTGQKKYKDIEDISLLMVDNIGKGMTNKAVVDLAIKETNRRNWNKTQSAWEKEEK